MKVKDQIFYQIATNRDFKVGDKLHFRDEINGQSRIFDFSYTLDGKPLHELAFKDSKKRMFRDKNLTFETAKALANYDLFMREIALEEVRKEKFPNLPSRFFCMYLSERKEDMMENFNKYKKYTSSKSKNFAVRNQGDSYQAIAVKVTGEAFFCKGVGIGREGLSFNDYKKRAVEYWSQSQTSYEKTKGILFIGDAEVVEIFGEIRP